MFGSKKRVIAYLNTQGFLLKSIGNITDITLMYYLSFLIITLFSFNAFSDQWEVDCGNHCFFNDIQPNCQGVYYKYLNYQGKEGKTYKNYSSWNSNLNGCYERDEYSMQTHLIYPAQINCNCPASTNPPPADKSASMTQSMREKLELLRAQVQAWTPCSPGLDYNAIDPFNPFTFREVKTCQYLRKNNLKRSYITVRGCYSGLQPWSDNEWRPCSFDGDQMANTPQMCLLGNVDLCKEILDAQDPVTGFWYRNGFMRRHPETTHSQPSFSRDQMLGMLSYWVRVKNKTAILKWLNAVKSNGKTAPWGPIMMWNLCPPRPNIPKPANLTQEQWDAQLPDDRCALIPEAMGLIYVSAKWAGVTDAQMNAIDSDFYGNLVSGSMTLDAGLAATAFTVPAIGSSAFQMGDLFDAVNIRFNAGGNNSTIQNALVTVNNRTSKLNPMYHFHAEGKATEYGAYLIRKYCTGPKPLWGHWFTSGYDNYWGNQTGYWMIGQSYLYSNWQYAGGKSVGGDYVLPHGHDCLQFLNLYLGNTNLTELECDNGDLLINGACKKFGFTPPVLAQVNGIDYKFNKSNFKIDYMAVDQTKCPYGGVFKQAIWNRCEFNSGVLSANQNANYFVDPTESNPGVYYPKNNGICNYGGTPIGNNCRIKSYPASALLQNVKYWVDPNPSWPGVYYQKVNGNCPYGGLSAGANCQVQSFSTGFLDPNKSYFTRNNPSYPGVFYYPRVVAEKRLIMDVSTPTRAD